MKGWIVCGSCHFDVRDRDHCDYKDREHCVHFKHRLHASGTARDLGIARVRADLLQRSEVGLRKYGRSLSDATELSLRDWLQHAYEECLDQANYLKCAMMKIDGEL